MSLTHSSSEADLDTTPDARPKRRHYRLWLAALCLLLLVLLLAFIPPLINASRFQLRIASNISASIGRPVHFDRVSPVLLPLPGFTLENFVVDEDPAFGSEPILRAGEVRATLRLSSLWRHVEFSKISLSAGSAGIDPSVNLVRNPDGHWNIESLLLQASHIQAAPTAQTYSSPARRFPYIEATGARLNLKLGQIKTPFSLTDADFALSLPEPHQWSISLKAHPIRTDTAPGDTGTLRVEGTLGGDANASLVQTPINLQGSWQDAQLGDLSRFTFGNDTGLRGDVSLEFNIRGSIGSNSITTHVGLAKARRADFIPDHLLALDATCSANVENVFQSYTAIECHWPPADTSDRSLLILTGDVPDVNNPRTATVHITLPAVPADTFFDWLHVATRNAPAGTGLLAGTLGYGPDPRLAPPTNSKSRSTMPLPVPPSDWSGELDFTGASIEFDHVSHRSIALGDVTLSSPQPLAPASPRSRRNPALTVALPTPDSFDLQPIELDLGGKQPATLEGHLDATGYTLHLTGTVIGANLLELGNAIPQLGDGLQQVLDQIAATTPDPNPPTKSDPRTDSAESGTGPSSDPASDHILSSVPIHIDLTATRAWGSPQTWRQTTPLPPTRPHRRK